MQNSGSVTLSELLSPARIKLELESNDRESVLGELVNCIPELSDRPEAKQTLLRALHEREQLHSTGIGDGIALPHSRNALVGLVDQPVVVFGRHPQGIAYGAPDAIPARLFFLIVGPEASAGQHVKVLSRIARLVRRDTLREQLCQADTPDQFYSALLDAEARA